MTSPQFLRKSSLEADTVLARISDLIAMLRTRQLEKELWIVEPGRVRIHQKQDV